MPLAESKSCDVYAVSEPGHHDPQTEAQRILEDIYEQTEKQHFAPELLGPTSEAPGAGGARLLIANVFAGEACSRNGSCGLLQCVTRCKPPELFL